MNTSTVVTWASSPICIAAQLALVTAFDACTKLNQHNRTDVSVDQIGELLGPLLYIY